MSRDAAIEGIEQRFCNSLCSFFFGTTASAVYGQNASMIYACVSCICMWATRSSTRPVNCVVYARICAQAHAFGKWDSDARAHALEYNHAAVVWDDAGRANPYRHPKYMLR